MIDKKLFTALRGKKIVILYDDLATYEMIDQQEFVELINIVHNKMVARGFEVFDVEVKDSVSDALSKFDPNDVVVFNWCEKLGNIPNSFHLVPMELDKLGFYYTGCDGKCIETTNDKVLTKEYLLKNKIPTPLSKVYKKASKNINGWNNFPAIVKPQAEHCSTGINKDAVVWDTDQLRERVNFVIQKFGGSALVEEFVIGEEYLVSIWGYDSPEVLPLVELYCPEVQNPVERIYSFNAKWEKTTDEFATVKPRCTENLDPEVEARIKDASIASFKKLGCTGYARMDVRVRDGQAYVIDVNANPDLMQASEFVMAANKLGMDHGDTFLKLCELALQKNMDVDVAPSGDSGPDEKETILG